MKYLSYTYKLFIITVALAVTGCATPQQSTTDDKTAQEDTVQEGTRPVPSELNRPVPNSITHEVPNSFFEATEEGTRTMSGEPGSDYWQQEAAYDYEVEVIPSDTLLRGSGEITYYNNSPDTLNQLILELAQNLHKEGGERTGQAEVTGGVNLERIAVEDNDLTEMRSQQAPSGYMVDGTLLLVRPSGQVAPGDSVTLQVDWNFKIPQQGISGRMGYSEDNLFYIGYWYPQMRVYDDVNGWFTDQFTGNAEFYHGFADYDIEITAPEQWMVASTGELTNADSVLNEEIHERLQQAHSSDEVVNVITEDDFGNFTQSSDNGTVTWTYEAEKVRDFAFSLTTESKWDATRANIGDRDGDGEDDYANINAIYRDSAPLWTDGAEFTQHSLSFLSEYTEMPYPWPHMTSVEGGGIIGGGMEFPMMTIVGAYNNQAPQALYAVIAHELAHMWVPMQISTNERRYAWMDEGTTTFNEDQAKKEYFPDTDFDQQTFQSYLQIAGTDFEGPIMRWSDYHYNGFAYGIASYPKPAAMLVTLRNMLGEETFNEAYHTFLDRWRYKHPYPWDMFNTFEDVTGQELDWFWRSWYYETWTLDQAVREVNSGENNTEIVIEDHGLVPMPATVEVTLEDGSTHRPEVPVDIWLKGSTSATLTVSYDSEITRVEIDPDRDYPDANRANNTWEQ